MNARKNIFSTSHGILIINDEINVRIISKINFNKFFSD